MASWNGAAAVSGTMAGDGPPSSYATRNADGAVGGNPAVSPFLLGSPTPPLPHEAGWKDTVIMYPGQVTRIVARWAPLEVAVNGVRPGQDLYAQQDGVNTIGDIGYVWHCHILDHEDNEMMRPYVVRADPQPQY
jgi:FtsP/CotA-like multicopper oxidase with cupredoxin domain